MANRDQWQSGGDDYSSGQGQLMRDDFSNQGSNPSQRSGNDRSSGFTKNQGSQGSNRYQADMDILSDSLQSSRDSNKGSRGGSENPGSGLNRTGADGFSNSARNPSDNSDNHGLNQYQAAMDRLTDLTQNSGGYDIKGQATNFLQQTGEQVKHIAQGAAEAVKSTLGMNAGDHNATSRDSSTRSSNESSFTSNNPSNRA
ncbi:hypothetical protein MLD38_030680 [Melastoma candidum]|uniref:Uncharacterized protein n=1 Tax=Melastoma candidum TaxID=119954 RepID=A0ACB9MMG3_9MYRT|nr:hypothetical protein MLD38_030680 [Melastoma candidum]